MIFFVLLCVSYAVYEPELGTTYICTTYMKVIYTEFHITERKKVPHTLCFLLEYGICSQVFLKLFSEKRLAVCVCFSVFVASKALNRPSFFTFSTTYLAHE